MNEIAVPIVGALLCFISFMICYERGKLEAYNKVEKWFDKLEKRMKG